MTYNGIQLPYPYMTQFSQEPLYDEDSLTTWYVTRFTVRVQCILNMQYLSITTSNGVQQSPAEIMNIVRFMLMQPRKLFSYKVNGVEMIPQQQQQGVPLAAAGTPIPGTVDAYNGPKPAHCNIHQMSDNTFVLDYMIVAHYWVNNPSDGTSSNRHAGDVLFNRWSEIVELDDCMFSRRIRDGYFRIRSDNTSGLTPDQLRNQMAVLSVPPKFLRVKSRYDQSKDGLTLRYHIEDQEVYKLPPGLISAGNAQNNFPNAAFRAEGSYTERLDGFKACYRVGEVKVRLYGSANTSQNQLIASAIQIASIKMEANKGVPLVGAKPINEGQPLVVNRTIMVDMYNNVVEVFLQAWLNLTPYRIGPVAALGNEPRSKTPGSDDSLPNGAVPSQPVYYTRGTASLLAQAAAYYDPNSLAGALGQGLAYSPGDNERVNLDTGPPGGLNNSAVYQMPGLLPGQAGKQKES